MGSISILGTIVILTGWFALIEYDLFSESERTKILERIKGSPVAIIVIALMPVGILINMLGSFISSLWMVIIGATMIFVQSIIVSLLFWRRKRWKSIVLLITMILLGILLYMPFFIHSS
ncbi:hypothetical protein [Oceanobacillus sp. Castelsardo]|uniref:hypothetical protein n=1 Tax=Oceanobacillus sp. Castelsardo TaxID=1851204 RepID=UPI00083866DC|nr:hypothetical protein [Oceanobacillus sp. Castelsardo]